METQQQLIGVSRELGGNFANMQGTTRAIFDTLPGLGAGGSIRFFDQVQTRPYPDSNISQNRFETGEALAIESIALVQAEEPIVNNTNMYNGFFNSIGQQIILDLYIGNQRVIKALDLQTAINNLGSYNSIGNTRDAKKAVLYLETPIVIPPLIEFYAEITTNDFIGNTEAPSVMLILQGTGTLLNSKSNF